MSGLCPNTTPQILVAKAVASTPQREPTRLGVHRCDSASLNYPPPRKVPRPSGGVPRQGLVGAARSHSPYIVPSCTRPGSGYRQTYRIRSALAPTRVPGPVTVGRPDAGGYIAGSTGGPTAGHYPRCEVFAVAQRALWETPPRGYPTYPPSERMGRGLASGTLAGVWPSARTGGTFPPGLRLRTRPPNHAERGSRTEHGGRPNPRRDPSPGWHPLPV